MKNYSARRFGSVFTLLTILALGNSSARAAYSDGIFELDGNAITNNTTTGLPDDWDRLFGPTPLFPSHALVKSFVTDPAGATIFIGGGSKDIQDITQWKYTTGSVPDKDELTHAYAAAYKSTAGDLMLYFGADRYDNSGDAQIGFWFFQNTITLKPISGSSGGFSGVHAIGDILILSDFTTGGRVSTVKVYEWVGSGGSDGAINLVASGVDVANAQPGDALTATVNSVATSSPWAYLAKGSSTANVFPPGTFYEGVINLSKILPGLECITSFLAETRSSQSPTATLKDFVTGKFSFAPQVAVGNTAICDGLKGTLSAATTGGVGPFTFSWTGPNGFTASTQTITVSTAGTYQVTVTSAANCKVQASGTVTVNPKPSVSITPSSAQICAGNTQTFAATVSGGTAPYTIKWSGSNGFTASTASITVATTGVYTVDVTDSKGCTASAVASLIVNPNPVVTIGGPVGCQTTPAMISANVTGGSGSLRYAWSGPNGFSATTQTISVATGGVYTVKVVDAAGCSGQASRALGLCLQ
ncbi:MAG: hypothetical protein QOD99_1440 [Chthoniobacter sp.]|jgi:hypothetical protein|nr:hypothetical protein [Chthoniobacter sp.]